jgi:hypothetical protein
MSELLHAGSRNWRLAYKRITIIFRSKKMTYYIINKQFQPLSSFDINDLATKNQLRFRPSDCITFSTEKEAKKYLDHIRANINAGNVNALTISKYAKF